MRSVEPRCIRIGALRLLLALIAGLLVVSGYVVAPVLFRHADPVEAGRLAGHVFALVHPGVLLLALAVGAFWLRMRADERIGWLRWTMLGVVVAAMAVEWAWLSPTIAQIKDAAGPIDRLPEHDPMRARFALAHAMGSLAHLLATLAGLVLVVIGPVGRREGG